MATPLRCSSISAAFIESRRQGRRRKTVCESEDWRKQSLKAVREIPIAGVLGYLDYETKFEVRPMLWTRLLMCDGVLAISVFYMLDIACCADQHLVLTPGVRHRQARQRHTVLCGHGQVRLSRCTPNNATFTVQIVMSQRCWA